MQRLFFIKLIYISCVLIIYIQYGGILYAISNDVYQCVICKDWINLFTGVTFISLGALLVILSDELKLNTWCCFFLQSWCRTRHLRACVLCMTAAGRTHGVLWWRGWCTPSLRGRVGLPMSQVATSHDWDNMQADSMVPRCRIQFNNLIATILRVDTGM